MKAFKDWKNLYEECMTNSVDNIVQYIMDNTNDPRAIGNGNQFALGYRESVKGWVESKLKL